MKTASRRRRDLLSVFTGSDKNGKPTDHSGLRMPKGPKSKGEGQRPGTRRATSREPCKGETPILEMRYGHRKMWLRFGRGGTLWLNVRLTPNFRSYLPRHEWKTSAWMLLAFAPIFFSALAYLGVHLWSWPPAVLIFGLFLVCVSRSWRGPSSCFTIFGRWSRSESMRGLSE